MSLLKDKIEINNGFFKALNEADSVKYNELFGAYNEALDSYFYFMYGYRTASNIVLQNTLTNVGHILWIRYYTRWKKYFTELNKDYPTDYTYKHETNETYKGSGDSNTINKKYGFDSDEGKNDTSNDQTNNNEYSKTFSESNHNVTNMITNTTNVLDLIDHYDYLNLIINDLLQTLTQPLYNDDEM